MIEKSTFYQSKFVNLWFKKLQFNIKENHVFENKYLA